MRVLVTGATGYVGSHAAAALSEHGHLVRVLARDASRVPSTLSPFGIEPEVAVGDMTDSRSVSAALDGCDAVIHAAGEVGVSGGSGPPQQSNVDGVRTVVAAAVEGGIDPIIYTSTVTCYLPTAETTVTLETPLATPLSTYGRSKRDAELLVRQWQDQGAPVTTFVIGGVYGPVSPHLDGSFSAIRAALETSMLVPEGGLGVIDVRDLGDLLARAVEPGRGPRRYLAGGRFLSWAEWTRALGRAAEAEVDQNPITAADMVKLGRHCDALRVAGKDAPPLSEEAAIIMTSAVPTDDTATQAELGVTYRPLDETFRDTVTWLRETDQLPRRRAS